MGADAADGLRDVAVARARPRGAVAGAAASVVMIVAMVVVPQVGGRADLHPPTSSPAGRLAKGEPTTTSSVARNSRRRASSASRCPWATAEAARTHTPAELAREVVAHMDLAQELGLVDLASAHGYENRTRPEPALCLPALTLQDGPNGIAFHATGVTQLPASLGIAASFDPSLAYSYGRVEGSEARRQGVDVVQGPELNLDRVPESGRAFEGYGEDPLLVSAMGVADVEGVQSEGVMADAKHFTAYNQETDRMHLDEIVSKRALEELYLRPFRAVVEQAHVASIMCAYGEIDHRSVCQDGALYRLLYDKWGFDGFVRSDLGAVHDPAKAFAAGLDMIKPAGAPALALAVADGSLGRSTLNGAVERILQTMFAYHLIGHPPSGRIGRRVDTPAHRRFALAAAEQSMVLLKNAKGVLPLARDGGSVAVIGLDAASKAMTAGFGSAHVTAPFVSEPLTALRRALGPHVRVSYAQGGTAIGELAPIASRFLGPARPAAAPTRRLVPARFARDDRARLIAALEADGSASTGSIPSWAWPELAGEDETLTPPRTGLYTFSLTDDGDAALLIGGGVVIQSVGVHGRGTWSEAVRLVAGRHYRLEVRWFPFRHELRPRLGWQYDGAYVARAVAEARRDGVAVVFVRDFTSEAFDRPTLALPGDEDALISAVAAANPRTVVVLNTEGAVLMPWLSKVAGVVEAWYPGEEDGAATAAVLLGRYDPSGHLPVTFPASNDQTPAHVQARWPGVDGTVSYDEGLDVGYRYVDAHHLQPLFPFGFGLSYTTFALSALSVHANPRGYALGVHITDTGARQGSEVLQAYLGFPASAGEPPRQLAAFTRVSLRAGQGATARFELPASAFSCFLHGHWTTVPGDYTLFVGDSSRHLPLRAELTAP